MDFITAIKGIKDDPIRLIFNIITALVIYFNTNNYSVMYCALYFFYAYWNVITLLFSVSTFYRDLVMAKLKLQSRLSKVAAIICSEVIADCIIPEMAYHRETAPFPKLRQIRQTCSDEIQNDLASADILIPVFDVLDRWQRASDNVDSHGYHDVDPALTVIALNARENLLDQREERLAESSNNLARKEYVLQQREEDYRHAESNLNAVIHRKAQANAWEYIRRYETEQDKYMEKISSPIYLNGAKDEEISSLKSEVNQYRQSYADLQDAKRNLSYAEERIAQLERELDARSKPDFYQPTVISSGENSETTREQLNQQYQVKVSELESYKVELEKRFEDVKEQLDKDFQDSKRELEQQATDYKTWLESEAVAYQQRVQAEGQERQDKLVEAEHELAAQKFRLSRIALALKAKDKRDTALQGDMAVDHEMGNVNEQIAQQQSSKTSMNRFIGQLRSTGIKLVRSHRCTCAQKTVKRTNNGKSVGNTSSLPAYVDYDQAVQSMPEETVLPIVPAVAPVPPASYIWETYRQQPPVEAAETNQPEFFPVPVDHTVEPLQTNSEGPVVPEAPIVDLVDAFGAIETVRTPPSNGQQIGRQANVEVPQSAEVPSVMTQAPVTPSNMNMANQETGMETGVASQSLGQLPLTPTKTPSQNQGQVSEMVGPIAGNTSVVVPHISPTPAPVFVFGQSTTSTTPPSSSSSSTWRQRPDRNAPVSRQQRIRMRERAEREEEFANATQQARNPSSSTGQGSAGQEGAVATGGEGANLWTARLVKTTEEEDEDAAEADL